MRRYSYVTHTFSHMLKIIHFPLIILQVYSYVNIQNTAKTFVRSSNQTHTVSLILQPDSCSSVKNRTCISLFATVCATCLAELAPTTLTARY
jgi:hypothetical protein